MFIFQNWLRKLLRRLAPVAPPRGRRPARLVVEALEVRTVPSANLQSSPTAIFAPFATAVNEGTRVAADTDLFQFHDPTGSAGDYKVDVSWGDGASDLGVQATSLAASAPVYVKSLGAGTFEVHATNTSHLYGETTSGVFAVTVTDAGSGKTAANSTSVTVNEVPVTLTATTGTYTATEGQTPPAQTLATFTDPAGPELPADYAVNVDWGNGTFVAAGTDVTISGPSDAAVFTVTTSHVYSDEVGFTGPVRVQVNHEGATSNVVSVPLSLTDPAVAPTAAALNPTEGTPLVGVGVATFKDPGGAEAAGDYSATIDWGDGTVSPAAAIAGPDANGVFTVQGNHTYAEESAAGHPGSTPYPITVVISHDAAPPATVTSSATVGEATVTATAAGILTATEARAGTVQTLATFTDPAGPEPLADYAAEVDWGNGTFVAGDPGVTIAGPGGGVFTVTGSHTYAEEDGFAGPVRVRIDHEGTTSAPVADPLHLTDPPVTLAAAASVNYPDFTSPAGLQFNGSAAPSGGVLRLTDGGTLEAGSAFYATPFALTRSFTSHFQFNLHDGSTTPGPAEGFTFALQDVGATALGTPGSGVGYAGILTSVAVEFDLARNPNTVDVLENGVVIDNVPVNPGFPLYGSGPVNAWVDYDAVGHTLKVFVAQSTVKPGTPLITFGVNLASVVGSSGFAGFTGGTGLGTAVQDIQNWQFLSPPPRVVAEGAALASHVVATFTDPGNRTTTGSDNDSAAEYTAAIAWGDGTAADTATVANGGIVFAGDDATGASIWNVLGAHAYAEESTAGHGANADGTYHVTVAVNHEGVLTPATFSEAVQVTDPALTAVQGVTAQTVTEGQAGPVALATFKDPGNPHGVIAAEDYTADVLDWGDGTGAQANVPLTVTYDSSSQTFTVFAPHTFAEESSADHSGNGDGTYHVSVQLHHEGTPDPAPVVSHVTVADPAVAAAAGPTISAVEHGSTNLVVLATFSDPGDPAGGTENPLADYSATVDWNDGTVESTTDAGANVFIVRTGPNQYVVEGTHFYTEEEPAGGGPFLVKTVVHHEGAPDSAAVTSTAQVTDPSVVVAGPPGGALAFTEGAASGVVTVATFKDPAGSELRGGQPAPGEYSAAISWGDGATTANATIAYDAAGDTFSILGSHTYQEEGSYPIGVQVSHGTSAVVNATSATANVADPAVVLNVLPVTFGATEGTASPLQPVATFTDPGGAEATGEYAASIDWGDGGTSAGLVTFAGGTFTVLGSHSYAEESSADNPGSNPYAITVTVYHGTAPAALAQTNVVANGGFETGSFAGWTLSGNSSGAVVDNQAHAGSFGAGFPAVGSLGFLSQNVPTVAGAQYTFGWWLRSDGSTPNEFQASWDGGTLLDVTNVPAQNYTHYSFTVTATGGVTAIQFGFRNDPGFFHLDDVTVVGPGRSAVAVAADPAVAATGGATASGVEGAALPAQQLATFTDPGGAEAVSDYSADIDWGTGAGFAAGAGSVSYDAAAHLFRVTGSTTYAADGTYTVRVRINHESAAPVVVTSTAVVADPQLVNLAGANLPAAGTEGIALDPITAIASFFDPGGPGPDSGPGDYSALVNWGDGTSDAGSVVADGGGNYHVNAPSHTYTEDGTYNVNVTLDHDSLPAVTTPNQRIVVADQNLSGLAIVHLPATATEGQAMAPVQDLAEFTDPGGDEAVANYTATIDWGDHVTSAATLVPTGTTTFRVDAPSHTYVEEGTFGVTVTVVHDALGADTSAPRSITIIDPQLTNLLAANLPPAGLEGSAVAAFTGIATFTDPGGTGAEPVTDTTATINWGDTTTSAGTVVSLGGGSYRVDAPAHTYAEEGSYTVNVTLKHDQLAALTTPNQTIVIADQPLTSLAGSNLPPTATEGVALPSIAGLATFTDPGGVGAETAASDYSAVVNWGDSTTSAASVVSVGGGNYRVDAPSHTYAEEGSYAVSVTIRHDLLASVTTPTQIIVVADQQVTGLTATNLPALGTEGATVAAVTSLATFTDPAGAEAVGDYTATINWGDSTSSTGTVVATGGNGFRVDAPAHVYAEDGTFSVRVTVKHDALPAVASNAQTIVIQDPPLTGVTLANLPATGTEGVGLGTLTGLATFTDPGGAEPAGDYTATINWGDTTSSTGTVVNTGGNQFRVDAPSHAYAEEGTYGVTVSVAHDALPPVSSGAQSIVISDPQITNLAGANLPANGQEGASLPAILGLATFTDPGGSGVESAGDFQAFIAWGNGTTPGLVVPLGGGSYRVDAPAHAYAEEGTYTVTVTVIHDGLPAVTTGDQTIVIADQPLTSLAGSNLPPTATEGVALPSIAGLATFTDPGGVGAETASDYSAVVNWGDTTTSAASVVSVGGGNYRVDAPSHTYAEEGSYSVSVTIRHDLLPSVTTPTQIIVVADQQVTGLTAANLPTAATEGTPVAAVTGIVTFTDPAGAEAVGDYTATINWGDNTFSAGTVMPTGGNGFRVDAPSHTYHGDGPFTLAVSVQHDALPAVTVTSNVTVTDPAVVLNTTPLVGSAVEGTPSPVQPVATFTDPGGAEGPANYTATINWGDGTAATAGTVTASGGTFTVSGSHQYAEESSGEHPNSAPYLVTVTVSHGLAPASRAVTAQVSVTDPAVQAVGSFGLAGLAGAPLVNQQVASFTDPGGSEAVADYTADVNWGSGFVLGAGTISYSAGSNSFIVTAGGATFARPGQYPVQVRINHETAPAATVTDTATINDPALNVTGVAVTGRERSALAGVTVATFTHGSNTDAASNFSATIDWGDGTTADRTGVVSASAGGYTVTGSHTYLDEGLYQVRVTVGDSVTTVTAATSATMHEELLPGGGTGTPNQNWVSEVYRDLLHRQVDAQGLAAMTGALNAGVSRIQVVAAIIGSDEYRANVVNGLYQKYLHRAADPTGLASGMAFLKAGGSDEQLAAALIASAEFYADAGSTSDKFLDALYTDALGHLIDPAGRSAVDAALASGRLTRAQVAAAVLSSPEYQQDLVQGYYQTYLDRPGPASDVNAWAQGLANGWSDEVVIAWFLSSAEFFNKANF